jgi:hypothetical protein
MISARSRTLLRPKVRRSKNQPDSGLPQGLPLPRDGSRLAQSGNRLWHHPLKSMGGPHLFSRREPASHTVGKH